MNSRIYVTRNKTGRQGKLRREEWVRVPRETIELLPERGPGEWLWPSRGVQARGHTTVNGALGALRRALKAQNYRPSSSTYPFLRLLAISFAALAWAALVSANSLVWVRPSVPIRP